MRRLALSTFFQSHYIFQMVKADDKALVERMTEKNNLHELVVKGIGVLDGKH